jgi:microcystin-dependent protein
MATPFVAQVQIFAFNFAPKGWAFCRGQLLPLSQNTALFSLLGTTYGGDGKSTFALPNVVNNAVISAGQGPGLSLYDLGEQIGSPSVSLLSTEMPSHQHGFVATTTGGTTQTPTGAQLATASSGSKAGSISANYLSTSSPQTQMNLALGFTGGSQPHNNMQPYMGLSYCIALQGIFPPRG